MKLFYFGVFIFFFVYKGNAQTRIPIDPQTLQKIQAIKGSNNFLTSRAAFDLYKKLNRSAIADTAIPTGSPQTYTFVWPQIKDGDNTLFFEGPIPYARVEVICLTSGIIDLQIPSCQSPGFYTLQLNCSFKNEGRPEVKVANFPAAGTATQQSSAVSMMVLPFQPTTFVFGLNLTRGRNEITISCADNTWFFQSLKISPLQ